MFRYYSVLLFFAVALTTVNGAEEKYSDKYDYINVTDILNNDRLRGQYYDCFIGNGPCITADQKFFKEVFPEVIVTQCRKCTEKQKQSFDIIVNWYNEHDRQKWDSLLEKMVHSIQKGGMKSS